MLSFLYRLIRDFQREHSFSPNVLYLNETHYSALRENLPQLGHEETERFLRLHIVLFPEATHPRVACQGPLRRRTAGDARGPRRFTPPHGSGKLRRRLNP